MSRLGKTLRLMKLFGNDFARQKRKLALTIVAIAWGTLTIVMLLAFGEGMDRQLSKARSGLGGEIMIIWGGQTTKPFEGMPRGRRIHFTEEDIELIRKSIPEIELISGEYTRWGAMMSRGKNTISERLSGVNPSFEVMRAHIARKGGRFLNRLDMAERRRVIFLGSRLKKKLFGSEDAVGKTILVDKTPFTVIGIMVDKMQMGMYNGPDENKASIPATTFHAIYGKWYRWLNDIVLEPRDPNQSEFVKQELYRVLGKRYRFDPTDRPALAIWDVIENRRTFNKILTGMRIFMGIIGALTLMVAGVGVANIMYVTVRRRTREIGIKLALGAKKHHILWQFLQEAIAIAALGGALGMASAFGVTKILDRIPVKEEGLKWLGKPLISPTIALIVVAILGVVGITSGYFPARKASDLDPVEALRYE